MPKGVKERRKSAAEQEKKQYIQNTGIKNFKLVTGTYLQRDKILNAAPSLESIQDTDRAGNQTLRKCLNNYQTSSQNHSVYLNQSAPYVVDQSFEQFHLPAETTIVETFDKGVCQETENGINENNTQTGRSSLNTFNTIQGKNEEYLQDLNLFMVSSKEKSEDEMCRVEKQLEEIVLHLSNIHQQIREFQGTPTSLYFNNLMSQLNHFMNQHQTLILRHQKLRKDIKKL